VRVPWKVESSKESGWLVGSGALMGCVSTSMMVSVLS
jgi:hypothetical protein